MMQPPTSTRTWIFLTTALILSPKLGAEAAQVIPKTHPGPVVESDGTPFEEPELVPQLPVPPKGPAMIPTNLESGMSGDFRAEESPGDRTRSGWASFLTKTWLRLFQL